MYNDYDPRCPAHFERRHLCFISAAGQVCISGLFKVLVNKHTVVQHDASVSQIFSQSYDHEPTHLESFSVPLLVTDDVDPEPWAKKIEGGYCDGIRFACTLRADMSGMRGGLTTKFNTAGRLYWEIDFKIEIFFGRTTLCAALVWTEQGQTKRGEVAIIPNSVF